MSSRLGSRQTRRRLTLLWLAGIVGVLLAAGCGRGSGNFLTDLVEARRLAADLRVQFSKATDASNRAVMADTDEGSSGFARDATATKALIQRDIAALEPVLRRRSYEEETRALEQFRSQFSEYDKVDRDVLALAVENTNLKAQRLSFGPAREAADAFRTSLESLLPKAAAKDRCRVEALVVKAVLAVRDIQALQAPHIAEADDARMTHMEEEMARQEAAAKAALNELKGLVEAGDSSALVAASAALDRFSGIGAELVKLSRRNTNVRSLELALRVKPPLTQACDESLRALQDALAKEQSQPSR
jgi:hypothetical protein